MMHGLFSISRGSILVIMDKKNKITDNNMTFISAHVTNLANRNLQNGTDSTIHSMELFRWKGDRIAKVGYEQAKGNLFEYIEGAKFLRNNANAGYAEYDVFPVTDVPLSKGGFGGHTAPDDFRLQQNGKIVGQAQAKVNNNLEDTANNFVNPKYKGMQKITTSDSVDEVKSILLEKLKKGEISQAQYRDAVDNIRSGLTDDRTGVTSGGTTRDELETFRDKNGKVDKAAVERYARSFENKQIAYEIAGGVGKGAVSGAVIGGIVSGVSNCWDVFQNRKNLDEALKETGLVIKKGAVKGGLTGGLSSIFRIFGKKELPILADSTVSVALAAAVVDCGVSIYSYAKGEIDGEQLANELKNTVIQASSAYYFTQAISITVGGGGVFLPMAIYAATSYALMSTKAIIDEAQLNAQEYRRIADLYEQETRLIKEYKARLEKEFLVYRQERKEALNRFLSIIEMSTFNENNYSQAIYAMVGLSNQLHFSLQHKEFAEFDKAMRYDKEFILK